VNTNVIYAGTRDYAATVGGVLKTVNSGITWTQVMSDSQVNALAINPVTRTVVYAGADGAGVYKSVDGGANWSPVNAGLTIYTIVRALAVDPSNPNVVYAGTFEGGVFRSTDGGMSWSAINSGLTNLNILSLAIDPSNTSVVYAGTQGDGVFKLTSNNVTPSPTGTSTGTPMPSITPTPTATSTVTATPTATSLGLPVKNLFLPLALRDFVAYFEGPFEVEPNDSYAQANGPLRTGRDYFGYPDDAKDYFSLSPFNAGTITITLSNYTGQGGQLQLFYQSVANRVAYDLDPPYQIVYNGAAGTYYVYLFTESGFNSATPYNLRVTLP